MSHSTLAAAREALGLSPYALALRAGVTTLDVRHAEEGLPVSDGVASAIRQALGLPEDVVIRPGTGAAHGIEVLGPSALRSDRSTAAFLEAALSLSDVRYLVRTDDREWAGYVRGGFGKWFRHFNADIALVTSALFLIVNIGIVSTIGLLTCAATLFYSQTAPIVNIVGIAFAIIITSILGFVVLSEDPIVRYMMRYFRPGRGDDHAYAVSDDGVWLMRIKRDRVWIKGLTIAQCRIVEIPASAQALLKIPTTLVTWRSEIIPRCPGLTAMVNRQRPDRSVRGIRIEPVRAAA